MKDTAAIRLLFFGATADIVGTRELAVSASTSSELLSEIVKDYPQLARHQLRISVNKGYVNREIRLKEGDEVAIFTAVSGG